MTIYERIKERRKSLNLSADDVAEALGVSRATIYRYESSEIEKFPTTLLQPLSKVLQCSPDYLMVWNDKVNYQNNNLDSEKSKTAKRIATYFALINKLNDAGKEYVYKQIDFALSQDDFVEK